MLPSHLAASTLAILFFATLASAQNNAPPQNSFQAHQGSVTCLAVSPNGTLASGGDDKTIRLWDARTGKQLFSLQGHEGAIRALQFAPSGQLVSGSEDQTVRFWDLKTRRAVKTLPHPLAVHCLALSKDGQLLATGTGESKRGARTRLHFWNVETLKELGDLDSPRSVSSLDFSSKDHALLSTNEWGHAILWNGGQRSQIKVFPRVWDNPCAAKFSPDGRVATTGYGNGVVVLWNIKEGEEQAIRRCHDQAVTATAFAPDGEHLATAGMAGAVKVFSVRHFEEIEPVTLQAHAGTVTGIAFSPNGKFLYSAGTDGSIAIRDVADAIKRMSAVPAAYESQSLPALKTATRVALVSTADSETARNLLDLVQVELSKEVNIEVLERAKIHAVLQEQKLALTGMIDANTAAKVGKILMVDLFAVVEVSAGGKEILGTVIYDAATGVKWQDGTIPPAGLDGQKVSLAASILQTAHKRAQGAKGIKTLCFASTRNADLPRDKDALCQSVGVLLERQLLGSSRIAILERKRLEYVNKEKSLMTDTGTRELLSSLLSVDLEISRGKQGKGLRGVAILTDNLGKALQKVEVETPGTDFFALVEPLQFAMQKALQIAAPTRKANLFRESRRFAREAAARMTHKDFEPAIQAIETAFALDPTNPIVRSDLIADHGAHARELLCPGTYRTGIGYTLEVSNRDLKKSLRLILRALEVRNSLLDHLPQNNPGGLEAALWHLIARFPPQYYYNNLAHAGFNSKGPDPWDDEARQSLDQVVALEQDYMRRRWELYSVFLETDRTLFSAYTSATLAYLDVFEGINAQARTRLGSKTNPEQDDNKRLTILDRWLQSVPAAGFRCDGKILDDFIQAIPRRPAFVPFLEKLNRHPHPLLNLHGKFQLLAKDHPGKIVPDDEAQQQFQDFKKTVLQTIRECRIEPGISEKEDLRFGCYWLYYRALNQWKFPSHEQLLQERFALCDFMLDRQELMIEPIKEAASSSGFGKDPHAERRWKILQRALALADSPQRQLASFVGQFQADSRQLQATLIKQQPRFAQELPTPKSPPLSPPFWDKKHQLFTWSDQPWVQQASDPLVIGDCAYLAMCGVKNEQVWLEVVKFSLTTKSVDRVGSTLVQNYPYKDRWWMDCIMGLCVVDDRLFVGTDKNGIYDFSLKTGQVSNLNADFELPSQQIDALAAANGKLFVALRGSYLLELDLKTKTIETLASSRRRQQLSPFDDGEIFNVHSTIADPARNRILFLLYQRPHYIYYPSSSVASKDATNGLWEYNWQTKTFKRHLEIYWSSLQHITPMQNGHVTITGTGVFDFDLATDKMKFLTCVYPVGPRHPRESAMSADSVGTPQWFHDGRLYSLAPLSRISLPEKNREYFPNLGEYKQDWRSRFRAPLSLMPIERNEVLCVDPAGVWLLELKK